MTRKKSKPRAAVQIELGDCEEQLAALPSGSADLILCDPPYNIGYRYRSHRDDMPAQDYLAWCERWLRLCIRALAPQGTLWLLNGDEFVSELDVLAKQLGLVQRAHVVWLYGFGVACTRNFSRSHTHLLYYVKHRKLFTFNQDAVRVPSARQLKYGDKRANPDGKLPDRSWVLLKEDIEPLANGSTDSWEVSRVCGTFHERAECSTNQLPEKLVERIVLATSLPGDLVLDPMCGSGTTAVVAHRCGRRFLGFDKDAVCVAGARQRVAAALAVERETGRGDED